MGDYIMLEPALQIIVDCEQGIVSVTGQGVVNLAAQTPGFVKTAGPFLESLNKKVKAECFRPSTPLALDVRVTRDDVQWRSLGAALAGDLPLFQKFSVAVHPYLVSLKQELVKST